MTEPKKRGRKTKREEAVQIAEALGLDPSALVGIDLGKPQAESGPVSLEKVAENVLRELNRRAGDPILAAEIPGTALFQLATRFATLLEEKAANARDEEAPPTLAEIVAGTAQLPPERKREILERERGVLEEELSWIDHHLNVLEAASG